MLRGALYDEGSATTYLGLTTPMFMSNPWQNPAIWDWMVLKWDQRREWRDERGDKRGVT